MDSVQKEYPTTWDSSILALYYFHVNLSFTCQSKQDKDQIQNKHPAILGLILH